MTTELATQKSDPRALSLLLYHKISKEIHSNAEELTRRQARVILLQALELLPTYSIKPIHGSNRVILYDLLSPEKRRVELNLQDAIDSVMVVWNDYREILTGRE